MYSENDLTSINQQIRERWTRLAVPLVVLFAGIVVSLVFRIQWLTSLLTVLFAGALMFCYDMLIGPLVCYRKHLTGVLKGKTHEIIAPFHAVEADISSVEGVRYWGMTVGVEDSKGRPSERLFYYDAELPRPEFEEGTMLKITYHDRIIAAIETV